MTWVRKKQWRLKSWRDAPPRRRAGHLKNLTRAFIHPWGVGKVLFLCSRTKKKFGKKTHRRAL